MTTTKFYSDDRKTSFEISIDNRDISFYTQIEGDQIGISVDISIKEAESLIETIKNYIEKIKKDADNG